MQDENNEASLPDINDVLGSIGADDVSSTEQSQETQTGTETASTAGDDHKPEVIEVTRVTPESEATKADAADKETKAAEAKVEADKVAAEKAAEDAKGAAGKTDAEKAAEAAAAAKKDDMKEHTDALEKEVPGGSHVKEATRKDWESLRTAGKQFKSKYEETATALAKVEAEKAELAAKVEEATKNGEVPETVKRELETLRERVAELDTASLPEFKAKYDDKIAASGDAVLGFFEQLAKGPNGNIEILDADGKPTGKLRKDILTDDILTALKESVAEVGVTEYDWSQWLQQCLDAKVISSVDARRVENTIANALNLKANKQVEIAAAKQNWAATQQAKEADRVRDIESHKTIIAKVAQETKAELDKLIAENEWAKPPTEPGAKATEAEKLAFKDASESFEQKSALFPKLIKTFYGSQGIRFEGDDQIQHLTPKELAGFVKDAFGSREVAKKVADLTKQLEEANKELDEFRAGGSTAPSSGTRGASTEAGKHAASLPTTAKGILDTID